MRSKTTKTLCTIIKTKCTPPKTQCKTPKIKLCSIPLSLRRRGARGEVKTAQINNTNPKAHHTIFNQQSPNRCSPLFIPLLYCFTIRPMVISRTHKKGNVL